MQGHEIEDLGWLAAQIAEPSMYLLSGALCAIFILFVVTHFAIKNWGDSSFFQ